MQTTSFVTVAGNCVTNPRNFEVSIGTPVSSLLERSGLLREPSYILEGGAMHGIRISDPDHTLIRASTSSILAFRVDRQEQLYSCIGCGRCVEACPSGLNPHKLYQLQLHLSLPAGPCAHHHRCQRPAYRRKQAVDCLAFSLF